MTERFDGIKEKIALRRKSNSNKKDILPMQNNVKLIDKMDMIKKND